MATGPQNLASWVQRRLQREIGQIVPHEPAVLREMAVAGTRAIAESRKLVKGAGKRASEAADKALKSAFDEVKKLL